MHHLEKHVSLIEFDAGDHNYLDLHGMRSFADILELLDDDPKCRCIVLTANGRTFCAGVRFDASNAEGGAPDPSLFYAQAMRIFGTRKPWIAAIQGAAVGAGLGLAVAADFRVGCKEARFSANFNRLGFHPGFGLSVTLPRLIGMQKAATLFYTARRIDGVLAKEIGLLDEIVDAPLLRAHAISFAEELAASAPIAVQSTRKTLRTGLELQVRHANAIGLELQRQQMKMQDFAEGVSAMSARREPVFSGI